MKIVDVEKFFEDNQYYGMIDHQSIERTRISEIRVLKGNQIKKVIKRFPNNQIFKLSNINEVGQFVKFYNFHKVDTGIVRGIQ